MCLFYWIPFIRIQCKALFSILKIEQCIYNCRKVNSCKTEGWYYNSQKDNILIYGYFKIADRKEIIINKMSHFRNNKNNKSRYKLILY